MGKVDFFEPLNMVAFLAKKGNRTDGDTAM
jgi:hypothetical protein